MNHYLILEDLTPSDVIHNSVWVVGPLEKPPMWRPPKTEIIQQKRNVSLPIGERFVYRESKLNPCEPPEVSHYFENTHRVRLLKFSPTWISR